MTDHDFIRLLTETADDYDERTATALAGLLRQAARRLAACTCGVSEAGQRCTRCGEPCTQVSRGRPRKMCLRCSPRKKTENGTMKENRAKEIAA